jgi:hypothetical protein
VGHPVPADPGCRAEVNPTVLVLARTGLAAAILLPIALLRVDLRPILRRWRWVVAFALIEIALPWVMLGSAEQSLGARRGGPGRNADAGDARGLRARGRGLVAVGLGAVAPWAAAGRIYLNFPGLGEDGEDLTRRSFGGTFERLAAIKRAWDPENVFRFDQNVTPAAEV